MGYMKESLKENISEKLSQYWINEVLGESIAPLYYNFTSIQVIFFIFNQRTEK
jgi:hypothetical protein